MGQSVGKSVTINGRSVDVIKQLGSGGFADIFLVIDSKTKVKYALKRLVVQKGDEQKKRVAQWSVRRVTVHTYIRMHMHAYTHTCPCACIR